jgi:FMN phosphatase YigB (HAD superfamily)
MKIAIDIDSTLHDYWPQFAAAAKRRFGVDLPYEHQVTWHITHLRPEQVKACVSETHAEPNVLKAEPYPGAVEAIARWKAQGHFIHITSHRATEAHDITARWLEDRGIAFDELYCSYDKVTRCTEIGIDVLIDDSPVNLQRAIDEGIRAATLLHPWNRELVEEEDVIAADDWPSLERELAPFLS